MNVGALINNQKTTQVTFQVTMKTQSLKPKALEIV